VFEKVGVALPRSFVVFRSACGHALLTFPAPLSVRSHRCPVGVDRTAAATAEHRGRPEKHDRRELVNAVLYLLRTGCAWRMLPVDFSPRQTVFWYFRRWSQDGTVDRIHDALRDRVRDTAGRDPMAPAGIMDAQSVKGADTVGKATRRFDAGKKTNGRKRHVVTDTLGLLLVVMVTAASVQDRDGGKRILQRLRFRMPSVAHVWADGGYAGRLVAYARKVLRVTIAVVRKKDDQRTFEILPRRWVVERTFTGSYAGYDREEAADQQVR
jgi:transposase